MADDLIMMLKGDNRLKVHKRYICCQVLFLVNIHKGSNVPDEDIRYAGDKFKESLELASDGMANLLDNEVCF